MKHNKMHGRDEFMIVQEAILIHIRQRPNPWQTRVVEATFAEEVKHRSIIALEGALQGGKALNLKRMFGFD